MLQENCLWWWRLQISDMRSMSHWLRGQRKLRPYSFVDLFFLKDMNFNIGSIQKLNDWVVSFKYYKH